MARRHALRATAIATAAAIVAAAAPAAAHTRLVSSSPKAGSVAERSLSAVSARFGQQLRSGTLRVYRGSRQVSSGTGARSRASVFSVRTTIRRRLQPGRYTARWRIKAADGHVQRGSWTFRVR